MAAANSVRCRAAGFDIVHLWGVALLILGMLAVGSPFLAAVAVNAFIAWLLVLAGVVHLTVCVSHSRGWQFDLESVGRASISLIWCVPDHASSTGCSNADFSASSCWLLIDGVITLAIRADDLPAMAIELRVGDRHTGRREHDHQRRYACDAVIGGAQGREHDFLEVGCLTVANV